MQGAWATVRKHWLAASLSAGALAGAWIAREPLVTFFIWISDRQAVAALLQSYGAWAPLVYIALVAIQTIVAVIPGQALAVAGAYVFGLVPSFCFTLPTAVLSSQLAFYLARWYGRPVAYRLASRTAIERWERTAAGQGIRFYFLSFLLPVFPSDVMCYIAGLGVISAQRFLAANFLGRSVATVCLTLAGAYIRELPGVVLTLGVMIWVSLYGVWYYFLRKSWLQGATQ